MRVKVAALGMIAFAIANSAFAQADVAVSVSSSLSSVVENQSFSYTISVTNAGPSDATGVVVTDTLPSGVTFVSASPGCAGTTVVTCNIGTLPSAPSQNTAALGITVTALPASPGFTLVNTVTVASSSDPNPSNDTASATTTVQPISNSADLRVSIQASPSPVSQGGPLTYVLSAANSGPLSVSAVRLSHTVGSLTLSSFVSASSTQGSCQTLLNTC